ncbi:MAG: Glu-tRNA(Gln) amidotransferase subunit GatE [Candidatus Altiarchaeota archaeon]
MDIDYDKLGFKCGIEIHQQLDTHKLFCECPSIIREDTPDLTVERRMRAVAGELGNFDPAALHEFLRNRTLEYQAYEDTNCLVELDEEPPHPVNGEALDTAIQVSLLLKADIVDEVNVMRKTVIDGSNTSGFQRTMLVAMNGRLDTSEGEVGIPTVCLEEDAARIIDTKGGRVVYRLDRLGIPLVEIATDPDIKNPRHAREVAEKIGSILRACKVKRGLGTIRQDINVSITGGERIEVKGVQDLKLISKVVEGEVARQLMLMEVKKELGERGAGKKDYDVKAVNVTDTFGETKSTVIQKAVASGGVVMAVRLRHMKGLLKGRLGPQLAQYVRGSSSLKGLFHGDELPAYGVSQEEVGAVMKSVKAGKDDSYAILSGPAGEVDKAVKALVGRCVTALECVPEETRRTRDDGSTEYMRPLPGSARMYPETDEPLVELSAEHVGDLRGGLPELREDKASRFEELGLSGELASQLSRSREAGLFEELAEEFGGVQATLIATTITSYPKEAGKRYGVDASALNEDHYHQIIKLISDGRLSKNAVVELIAKVAENPGDVVAEVAESNKLTMMGDDELKSIIDRIRSENKDVKPGQLMGKVMAEVRGRADTEKVRKLLGV